ncbi:MAG: phosphatidylserine decarboxylase family protein [Nitrospirae bacterium]|nr:phosphatidylserine decarboxylase family protein [Nitrospirota bacterium]
MASDSSVVASVHLPTRRLPLAKEGWPFILPFVALGGILMVWTPWGALAFAPALFSIWFFRDPRRIPPEGDALLVSPADGRVVLIQPIHEPLFLKRNCTRVSIFMSPMNVHVNRMPRAGQVKNVRYSEGRFHVASKEIASKDNEQNAIHVRCDDGSEFMLVQIAGILARRIICDVRPGQQPRTADRIGLIRFGSRVDLYLPDDFEPCVSVGQKVAAGTTVVATQEPNDPSSRRPRNGVEGASRR